HAGLAGDARVVERVPPRAEPGARSAELKQRPAFHVPSWRRPMTNAEAFLEAIREEPDDDTHRLVYADWLEANGPPDRAEFIRIQCELARAPGQDPDRLRLQERERALLALHDTAWAQPLRGRVRSWTFRRGFLWEVTMTVLQFRHRGDAVFRATPVQ